MPGTTDTVKAMLTPGEFVIRKEAVDMIGVPILEKLNDMPEAGGHSEIDRLIAKATLKNMTGMYGGGMVNAKQYMGGGKVDMYGHGGKVKNQMMMGYEHGGEAHGNLKPVPDDNPGLAKLPEAVRNKMGYMQEGGSVLDMALRRAEPMQLADPEYQNLSNMLNLQDPYSSLLFKIADIKAFTDPKTGRYLSPEEEGYGKSVDTNKGILRKIREMDYASKQGVKPSKGDSKDVEKLMDLADKLGLVGMMKGGMAKKKKKYGYQNGGSVSDIVNNALESDDYSTIQSVLYDMQEAKGNKADEFNYNLIKATDPVSGNILYDYQSAKGVGLGSKGKEMQVSEIDGKLYQYPTTYSGGIAPSIKNLISKIRGVREISNLPEEMMGMQEGGAVQDDAMMLQYLQSLQAQQANPFVPFDQRPPSSGEMMSPIPSGMEQGDMMRIIRDEREVLDMQDAELLRQKAQNALTRFQLDSLMEKATLDSLINQGSGDAMKIQRSPNEPFSFPNTPAQENFMQKYKEEMIDPTYFPEGS